MSGCDPVQGLVPCWLKIPEGADVGIPLLSAEMIGCAAMMKH